MAVGRCRTAQRNGAAGERFLTHEMICDLLCFLVVILFVGYLLKYLAW